MGNVQPFLIQTVASHPYTDSIADKLFHQYIGVPFYFVIFYIDLSLLQDGNLIHRHFWSQFVLKTVNLNKLAVQLFFVLVELIKTLCPLGLKLLYKVAQTERRIQVTLGYFLVAKGYKGICVEVPRGLMRIPI